MGNSLSNDTKFMIVGALGHSRSALSRGTQNRPRDKPVSKVLHARRDRVSVGAVNSLAISTHMTHENKNTWTVFWKNGFISSVFFLARQRPGKIDMSVGKLASAARDVGMLAVRLWDLGLATKRQELSVFRV